MNKVISGTIGVHRKLTDIKTDIESYIFYLYYTNDYTKEEEVSLLNKYDEFNAFFKEWNKKVIGSKKIANKEEIKEKILYKLTIKLLDKRYDRLSKRKSSFKNLDYLKYNREFYTYLTKENSYAK